MEYIVTNATEYFPVNIEDYVVAHSALETVVGEDGAKNRRVLVVAVPQQMLQTYYEVASVAGLTVQSIDYIGNAMLQLIKTQTNQNTTTMVIQLGSESTVAVHIRHLREKLEIDPANPRYLKVVWGKGYKLEEMKK